MNVKHLTFIALIVQFHFAVAAEPVQADRMVNARYTTEQCALPCQASAVKQMQWWLMREEHQVEIRQLSHTGEAAHYSSLWQKKPAGQYHYSYLMHDERRAIDYTDVDLKLLAIKTDAEFWQLKNQLISDAELASLRLDPTPQAMQYGYGVEKYSGSLSNGIQAQVWWLPALKLPARVVYLYPQHQVSIQLQALESEGISAQPKGAAPHTSWATLSQYQHVDYADLGDMEHNPSEMHWLSKAHGAPGLHAHAH